MTERELSGPPSMAGLFARAGFGMVPGAARLPFVGGGGGPVPELTLIRSSMATDRDRLAAYDRVCGFDLSDTLPATYPHVLAFGMQLSLMTSGAFPVAAIGLVHIANRIVAHRPIGAGERLTLRVRATELAAHPRGRSFDLCTEARVGDELVWEERSTNLVRGRREDSVAAPEGPPDSSKLPATATWRLAGDLGRRYGSVSGDLNPIHIHPLSAKLFGFPTAIAHGMWTQARCLAQLRLGAGPFTVQVAFRRPILLPATVAFAEGPGDAGIAFGVRDARKDSVHLDGTLTPGVQSIR